MRAALATGDVGAVLVEPMLGRGGCVVPPASFLPALRSLADEAGALLVARRDWTGMGRTGAMLATARGRAGRVCLGKGLGGGVPISACVGARVRWMRGARTAANADPHRDAFRFAAGVRAALATLETLRTLRDVRDRGAAWQADLKAACPGLEVHGRGLMVGVRLANAAEALAASRALLTRGFIVLTGGIAGDTLTLSPALTTPPALLSAFAHALGELSLTRSNT